MSDRTKILFVDDEINILNGLKRSLHSMSQEWDMSFTDSARNAMNILSEDEYDIVVTDMRMPELSGLDLLKYVYLNYPKMVRIILSGHTDRSIIMKTIGLAHQFFTKPSNSDDLIDALKKIIYIRSYLNNTEILKILSLLKSIPVMPVIYNELIALMNDEEVSLKKVGDLISKDIGLSTKILQLVNSSFFAVMRHVSDIHQAINLLGMEIIKDMLLSFQVFTQVDKNLVKDFHLSELWTHSLATAYIAKSIAKDLNLSIEIAEMSFIAGILHDVGKLILVTEFSNEYHQVIDLNKNQKMGVIEAENKILGISHNVIVAYLASIWGFSQSVIEATFLHHNPGMISTTNITITTCIHLADYIHHHLLATNDLNNFVNIGTHHYDEEYINALGLQEKVVYYLDYFKELDISGYQIY